MLTISGCSDKVPQAPTRSAAAPAASHPKDSVALGEQPRLEFVRLNAPGNIAVASVAEPGQLQGVAGQLLGELKAWPSLWATVAMAPTDDGNTRLLVATRDGALQQSAPEGACGLLARLCSTPDMRAAARQHPVAYEPARATDQNLVSMRLPGRQTAETLTSALATSGQPNQKTQLKEFIDGLPQGQRVAILLGGPSGAGKTSITKELQELAGNRKITVLTGDNYFLDVDDPNYPMTPEGTYYFDSPQAMHMDELAGDIAKLISTGHADVPIYDFAATRPGGWHRPVEGVTGVRKEEKLSIDLGGDDILAIDSLHATNPAIVGQLDGVGVSHRSLYLDSQRSEDRLLRRIVRDFEQREGTAERTLSFWDKTTFPGEVLFVRPTLLQMDPSQDLQYTTKFPTDIGLTRPEINHKVEVFAQYGLAPTYGAFGTPDDKMTDWARSEKERYQKILATSSDEAERSRAQRGLQRLASAPHPTI